MCLKITRRAIAAQLAWNGPGISRKIAAIGVSRAELIEASDTIFAAKKVRLKKTSAASASQGLYARKTPRAVATPFPPLIFPGIEKQWPATTLNPHRA